MEDSYSAIITWFNIARYCINDCRNSDRISIRCWIPDDTAYLTLTDELWGVSFVKIFEKIDRVITVRYSWTPHRRGCDFKCVSSNTTWGLMPHDDVIRWKHFPRYWPFVRGIHRSSVNFPHKGQWRVALMLSLICVWIDGLTIVWLVIWDAIPLIMTSL